MLVPESLESGGEADREMQLCSTDCVSSTGASNSKMKAQCAWEVLDISMNSLSHIPGKKWGACWASTAHGRICAKFVDVRSFQSQTGRGEEKPHSSYERVANFSQNKPMEYSWVCPVIFRKHCFISLHEEWFLLIISSDLVRLSSLRML